MTPFPAAFPKDPRALHPLKIGIRDDLLAALGGDADEMILQRLLARHTRCIAYLRALTRETHRVDLDGRPVQDVDDRGRALAAQKLEEIEARRQAREAPRTPPQDKPPAPRQGHAQHPRQSRTAAGATRPPADRSAPDDKPRPDRKHPRRSGCAIGHSGAKLVPIRIRRKHRPGP